ncbi:hypothetical protein [Parashewanella tropica]|nr:hypothetical protein [Parashewanella tropica]
MKSGYCPKCKNTCDVTFARSVVRDGKVYYPKKAKCFVIPHCTRCNKK